MLDGKFVYKLCETHFLLFSFYGAFSMDVIASAAFSTKIDSHNDPNNKFVQVAQTVFTKSVPWRFYLFGNNLIYFLSNIIRISVIREFGLQLYDLITLYRDIFWHCFFLVILFGIFLSPEHLFAQLLILGGKIRLRGRFGLATSSSVR